MERKYKVELELTAGEMGGLLRSLCRAEFEECRVNDESREYVVMSRVLRCVRMACADALCGAFEWRRWARCLGLVYAWKNRGIDYEACMAAADVRLGKVA